jgi:glucokinase
LPGWDDIKIVKRLEAKFGVNVFLQNDADACALAEWKIGAGKGCTHMIFLTFGTGFGGGLILNGKLYSGACGMAGEAGHIRLNRFGPSGYGKPGSLEGFCSGGGIAQLARTTLLSCIQTGRHSLLMDGQCIEDITAKDVFLAAKQGDATALEIVSVVGEQLGMGLAILIDVLNPERIVIGSIYQRNHVLLQPYIERVIARETLIQSRKACKIVPAALGDSIGDYAAVLTAVYGMEEEKP